MSKLLHVLLLLVSTAVLARGPEVGKPAPEIQAKLLDGSEFRNADAVGHQVVILNFWATWCAPCREEMPEFVAAQARDGPKGVQFVGIAVDDPDKVRAFAQEVKLNYPALIGGYGAIELSKTLGNELAALPFTIVVDREGRVAHTQLGPLKRSALDGLLSRLLPQA